MKEKYVPEQHRYRLGLALIMLNENGMSKNEIVRRIGLSDSRIAQIIDSTRLRLKMKELILKKNNG